MSRPQKTNLFMAIFRPSQYSSNIENNENMGVRHAVYPMKSVSSDGQKLVLQTSHEMTKNTQVVTWSARVTGIELISRMYNVIGENRMLLFVDSSFTIQWVIFSSQNTSSCPINHINNWAQG